MTSLQPCLCPVCGDNSPTNLLEIESVPVYCNVLWPKRELALAARRGVLDLKYCAACGHVFNAIYDAGLADYTLAYDNSLHFSPQFNEFTADLVASLIERHQLRGKTLVEIGCGKGDFLMELCQQGQNRGWGYDRSFDPQRFYQGHGQGIHFLQDFYNAEHARRLQPDFVCCRQVLEHLADPRDFLDELRRGFGDHSEAALYFEVPNSLFTLKDMGIWDLIYEHCGYYSLSSFTRLVVNARFDVLTMGESFGGQFIFVEMRPGNGRIFLPVPQEHQPANVSRYAAHFAEQYHDKVRCWRERLRDFRRKGRTAVIWGSGSKGVTFLNVLGNESGIDYAVDLNPYKHGKYVPGTGQRVVPPEFLRELRPSDVIVMNSIYKREITDSLQALGLKARVSCI